MAASTGIVTWLVASARACYRRRRRDGRRLRVAARRGSAPRQHRGSIALIDKHGGMKAAIVAAEKAAA